MDSSELPKGWSRIPLREVGVSVTGNTPPTKDTDNYGGKLPYIKPPQLRNNIFSKGEETLSEKGKTLARVLPPYSVLVSCIGNLGRIGFNQVSVAFNQQINAVIPNSSVLPKFLFYQAQSSDFRNQLEEKSTATTISIVNKGNFEKVLINLAPLNEQKSIIAKVEELFSELDSGIASLKTAQEQLKIYRQALLKHAFEGKLTAQWRKDNADKLETPEQLLTRIQTERETRYQQQLNDWKQAIKEWGAKSKEGKKPSMPKKLAALKKISKSELSELTPLPINWSYVRLGHLIDEPTYGTSAKCEYDSGNTGVLRIPNIKSDAIDDGDLKFASFDEGEIKHFALEEGDLLTIRSNGSISLVGTCALVKEKDTKYIFAGYLIRLRPNQSSIHPSFLLAVLTSHLLRRQIETAAKSTSGVNNINSGELQNLIIPIPTIQEQHELLKYLDTSTPSIDATELEIDRQLLKSETLRQSILKKAFSGQLVSSDLNDRSESVKPSRAKAEK